MVLNKKIALTNTVTTEYSVVKRVKIRFLVKTRRISGFEIILFEKKKPKSLFSHISA